MYDRIEVRVSEETRKRFEALYNKWKYVMIKLDSKHTKLKKEDFINFLLDIAEKTLGSYS